MTKASSSEAVRVEADREFIAEVFGEEALDRLPTGPFGFRFSRRVRQAFRSPRKLRVSEWAQKHMLVVEGSRPGPWRNENAPYLVGVLDAWGEPHVREVVFVAAPQVGKSKVGEVALAFIADMDPSPCMYVVPDEESALDVSRDRLLPLFQESPRLSQYLSPEADNRTLRRLRLTHMPLYLAWARSASRLASKAIKVLIFDEVDKYPETAGRREADPLSLGEKRQRTYRWDRKTLKFSSPSIEAGPIWVAFHACEAVFHYHARCPVCGFFQRLHFTAPDGRQCVVWPENERDPNAVEAGHLAKYACVQCAAMWDDHDRDKAVRMGEWREEKSGAALAPFLREHRPSRVGFHLSALYSQFVSLSEVAAAFLKALKDKTKLKDFLNNYLAEPWVDVYVERSEDRILALRDDRPRGLVPGGGVVAALTAGVDTQDDGFWYEIRAWGFGSTLDSWQVREGFVTTFEALEEVLCGSRYADALGQAYVVALAVMDAMGHRTAAVYDFCRRFPRGVLPFKGEQRMAQPFAMSLIDAYPGTRKPIPGGIYLLRGNVTYYKDQLAHKLDIAPGDPGAWRLHAECSVDWARQMCAEGRDARGVWVCPKNRANHGWDVSVYNLIAADVLEVKFWPRPGDQPAPAPKSRRTEHDNPFLRGRRW